MSILDSLFDFQTNDASAPISYVVTRLTAAVPPIDAHGRAIAPTPSTFVIGTACLQPLTGRDLLVMPEGERSEETKWLYSDTELRGRGPTNAPDEVAVTYPSGLVETYVVKTVEFWPYPPEGVVFWRAKVARRAVP